FALHGPARRDRVLEARADGPAPLRLAGRAEVARIDDQAAIEVRCGVLDVRHHGAALHVAEQPIEREAAARREGAVGAVADLDLVVSLAGARARTEIAAVDLGAEHELAHLPVVADLAAAKDADRVDL